MSTSERLKAKTLSDTDLHRDPGIGRTRGTNANGAVEQLDGEHTFEGDVKNDPTPSGRR